MKNKRDELRKILENTSKNLGNVHNIYDYHTSTILHTTLYQNYTLINDHTGPNKK